MSTGLLCGVNVCVYWVTVWCECVCVMRHCVVRVCVYWVIVWCECVCVLG